MKKLCFLAVILVLLVSACKQPKDLVYQNIQNFKVEQGGLSHSKVSLDIKFYNPNGYQIKLKRADVDVYINDKLVGKMITDHLYKLPALDTFAMPVSLDVDMKNVLPNALQVLFSKTVNIKLIGYVKTGRSFIYVNVPVNYEGKQDLNLF